MCRLCGDLACELLVDVTRTVYFRWLMFKNELPPDDNDDSVVTPPEL